MKFTNTNDFLKTKTHQWGTAYKLTAEQELVKLALTSFVDKSFYEKATTQLERIQELCSKVDKEFLIKLAVWGRKEWLRTINQILLLEGLESGYFPAGLNALVKRPDELLEIVGYYALKNWQNLKNLKLANKLKKALKKKLESFDDYRIAKYRGKWEAINLYDLVNITHAYSPTIDKLMKGELASAETWEKKLSTEGNNKQSRQALLEEKNVWALAGIRNIRNMLKAGLSQKEVLNYILESDFSKVFPYQAIQALHVCVEERLVREDTPEFQQVLAKVWETFKYIANCYPGKIAVGIDCSWSMSHAINSKSNMTREWMALYYGQLLKDCSDNIDLYLWANNCCFVDVDVSMKQLVQVSNRIWGWTNIGSFTGAISNKEYDRAIILTDEQIGDAFTNVAKKGTVIWNLASYWNSMASSYDSKVQHFSGYNDAQWRLASSLFEIGDLVKKIKEIEL